MSPLIAEIRFGQQGNSADHMLSAPGQGWAEIEPTHRWSIGRESHIRLPLSRPAPDCVVVLDALPWCHPVALPAQTIMPAVNGRLLSTFQISDHRALAFILPPGLASADEIVLSLTHLNSMSPRPPEGLSHSGLPLGLLFTSIRIYCQPPHAEPPVIRTAFPGTISSGTLQAHTHAGTGLSPGELAALCESIGENCEFGLVQRAFGTEPLGLLRFASCLTHTLTDGLFARFADIGNPDAVRIFVEETPEPEYKVHEQTYYLWYSTGTKRAAATPESIRREQSKRLAFLQQKLVEDLRDGRKIYVHTRPGVMTEPEALALFCALQMEGPNTLLWTTHGDPRHTGSVERLRPGFLHGHLGPVDHRVYASHDAWLSVLANAYLLADTRKAARE